MGECVIGIVGCRDPLPHPPLRTNKVVVVEGESLVDRIAEAIEVDVCICTTDVIHLYTLFAPCVFRKFRLVRAAQDLVGQSSCAVLIASICQVQGLFAFSRPSRVELAVNQRCWVCDRLGRPFRDIGL